MYGERNRTSWMDPVHAQPDAVEVWKATRGVIVSWVRGDKG